MVHDVQHKVKKCKYGDNTKRKISSQFLEDNPETSAVECHQKIQSPMLHGHRTQKRKKCTVSLKDCGSLETVTIDSEKDLSLSVKDARTKKKRKHENKMNGSRSEGQCNGSDVQNLNLGDYNEKKNKKRREKCTSLGGYDSSAMGDLVLKNQLNDEKKQRKEKHIIGSRAACDSLQQQNIRLFGQQKKKKHYSRPLAGDCVMGTEDKQKNNKIHHLYMEEKEGIFKRTTTEEKNCGLELKGDDILGISAKGTLQSMNNSKLLNGERGKMKRKHRSISAESGDVYTPLETLQPIQNLIGKVGSQKKKKFHSKSGDDDSATITGNPYKESETSESAEVNTETSPKKRKKKKMCDTTCNETEILPKFEKKYKETKVLPFETVVEKNCSPNLLKNPNQSLKKHKVKCKGSGISQNTAPDHSMTIQNTDTVGNIAEQTEQADHNSSMICQETVKIPKKLKCKRHKKRHYGSVHCSGSSSEDTLQVVVTPESITKPSKNLKTQKKHKKKWKQRQHVIVFDDNIDNTFVERPQEKDMSFSQDTPKVMQISKSQLVEQLKDFDPSVENMTTGTLYNMYKYDLPRFEKFKEEGIPIRKGRFTKNENEQLQKNVKELMELTGIQNEWELFHVPESADEMMRVKQLKQNNLFCIKLAEGIPRPWKSVYQRAKKMYDPNRCKGRYTEEELEKLSHLQMIHGNQWIKIAKLMDRSDASVLSRARLLKKSLNNGAWSKKEVKTLMKIMEQIMKERIQESSHDLTINDSNLNVPDSIMRENLYKKLPWSAIAEQMEHRNWLQCRQKWMNILATKMSGGSMDLKMNSYQNNVNLIKRLYLSGIDDIGEVNWDELCSAVGDVPPITIQRMFYRLKNRYVPNWTRKSFGAIIEFLYDYILPKMEAALDRKGQVEDAHQTQHIFHLSDIFNDIDNSDTEDENDETEKIHPSKEDIWTSVHTPVRETH
ncbi:transcription termination factor 1-like [Narcine bancroftii]|uniref:transcription termination factor 1-like n=1 Tax=Narcine bancroftii TaxID=1343680 RepID=UPI003831F1B7